jgi:hypothetical protein
MQLLIYICVAGFLVSGMASLFVWAVWMQRFVEAHGERTAFVLYNIAPLRDYRTARRISDRIGRKPRFLIWYERLQITAVSFFIAGIVTLLIGS